MITCCSRVTSSARYLLATFHSTSSSYRRRALKTSKVATMQMQITYNFTIYTLPGTINIQNEPSRCPLADLSDLHLLMDMLEAESTLLLATKAGLSIGLYTKGGTRRIVR